MHTTWRPVGHQSYELDESNSLRGVSPMMCNSYHMNDTNIKVRS